MIETLAAQRTHVTAPELVGEVQERAPEVGRASVYRTLELLTRLGLAQSSTLGGSAATYLLTPSRHHHHLVCVECHRTIAFDECILTRLEQQLGEEMGFQLSGHLVELYGRCADCLSQ